MLISCFHILTALLYQYDIKAETHNGIKTQFFLHFIRNGKIGYEYGKLYSHLFDWRQETDYADFREFDEKTVQPILKEVRVFINKEDELIKDSTF